VASQHEKGENGKRKKARLAGLPKRVNIRKVEGK
jgi:hypothetical protein